jgi:hypothetical protein
MSWQSPIVATSSSQLSVSHTWPEESLPRARFSNLNSGSIEDALSAVAGGSREKQGTA